MNLSNIILLAGRPGSGKTDMFATQMKKMEKSIIFLDKYKLYPAYEVNALIIKILDYFLDYFF